MNKPSNSEDTQSSPPVSQRLTFCAFQASKNSDSEGSVDEDRADLAALLGDPELTRNITANGSTPERCRQTAGQRIAWHNSSWQTLGFGVWALRLSGPALALPGAIARPNRIVGWCGFAEADVPGEDPEILYGLSRDCRGYDDCFAPGSRGSGEGAP